MAEERILLVDDQPEILEPVRRRLLADGYQVVTAATGPEAIERFRADHVQLIVLDVMLPKMDGLSVCRLIRAESDVPILILSAKSEETNVVVGLELGADDYLCKPFRMNELLARVRALLRRRAIQPDPAPPAGGRLQVGAVSLDERTREVTVDGRLVSLTPVEFRLLAELARHPGEVLDREVLLAKIWGYEGYDPGLVNTHVKRLRAKVEEDPASPRVVLTVRGFGYKLAI